MKLNHRKTISLKKIKKKLNRNSFIDETWDEHNWLSHENEILFIKILNIVPVL